MPPIFKALATISAWILFVAGCANFVITLVMLPVGGTAAQEWSHTTAFLAIATASIISSAVTMNLRQMLEFKGYLLYHNKLL
ncbi:hypothetical protein ACFL4C_04165 [Candidatus Omnitrophota bacterium]